MGLDSAATRMVRASDLRDWLRWLHAHFDPEQDTPQSTDIRRPGRTLEALGRAMGAIALTVTTDGTSPGERGGEGACQTSPSRG